jgi:DNA polymerase-3 subunit delta'
MQFSDVIGQVAVKKQLADALLFLGREGNGALALAIAFAQYMVCEKISRPQVPAGPSLFGEEPVSETALPYDSCGKCAACTKAAQLIHPDIHFSYPTVTKKPGEKPVATDFIQDWREFIRLSPYGNLYDWIEQIKEKDNSQGKITAEECNDIIRKLGLKSFESRYKILIMWMPEMLGAEGNKLLKLIEEPPPDTLFILVTENEGQVLQTIVSRCQLIKIPPLDKKEVADALVSRNRMETLAAGQVAGVSEGNYREALQLAQHSEEDWQSLLREWLNATLKTGPIAQAKWVDEISRLGREKQKQFLRYFNHLLEQAIRYRVMGTPPGDALGAERDFAERLNKIAGIEQQQAIIEELDRASYYIERNANAKILFHALTIKLYHIIQDKIVFLTD